MNTAFIGLDYIVEITHPDGKMAAAAEQVRERNVIDNANRALAMARRKGWLSVLVKVGFERGYPNHPARSRLFGKAREAGLLEAGSAGMAFHPELDADLADMVIVKPRVNAFYGTGLDPALRARRIERVVLAGVSTAMAIQSAARDAHDRDYEVLILEQACAAASEADHRDSIRLLDTVARVVTLEELEAL
ncbi:cysteine hydrolase [Stutzerimonas nosocomialis]|uniref:isochorismatase family cysteine hydrolase n=1 Tax=Stutzerimonas nosocomialis TaxID=1056496 RepID=UPI001107F18A|nr:isochorismatase family cysteine hydrolase [Stutzerimonas nosocomialis]TLX53450.1 cysteine hydrolase [Stutzerimonas nosocomialis]